MRSNALDVSSIKINNTAFVLNCIRNGPISRVEISRITKLSKSTVTLLTNELINDGIIYEIGSDTGNYAETKMGRRPILLDIDLRHRFVIGVNLHRKQVSVSLIDLKIQIIDTARASTTNLENTDEIMRWIVDNIHALMDKNELTLDKCIGIGCSSPGPVDYKKGIILESPNFTQFWNYPLADNLRRIFNIPVILENNSVLLANTEYRLNSLSHYSQLLFIIILNGVGSALISKGEIMRGSAGFAGEIGHMSVDINGIKCLCGNHGCLEQYLPLSALRARFGFEQFEQVVDDAYNKRPYAVEIMEYISRTLSCALINCINMLDLDAVVISGELNYRPELLYSMIQRRVHDNSVISKSHNVSIIPSAITPENVDIACASRIIDKFFNQEL